MCDFGSIWCHGDRIECRVTGWGKGNVLAVLPLRGKTCIWYSLPIYPEEKEKCAPRVHFCVTLSQEFS